MNHKEISSGIIGAAIEVHRHLGPGLLESAYQNCLMYELTSRGMHVKKEVLLPVSYKGVEIDHGYRIDILVENKVVIELKTVEFITEVHQAQILTYLKLGGYEIGLLLNFNVSLLKDGIRRFIM